MYLPFSTLALDAKRVEQVLYLVAKFG